MYHMWAPQCQIQLGRSKRRNDGELALSARPKLADPIWSGVRRMDEGGKAARRNGRLDTLEACNDAAGLMGHGERVERGPFEQAVDELRQFCRRSDIGLESAREDTAPDRLGDGLAGPGHPHAAA